MKILAILLPMGLMSCSGPVVSYGELLEATRQPPYVVTLDQFPYRLSLHFQPVWASAQRELKENPPADEVALAELLNRYQGGISFILKIGPHPDLPTEQHKVSDIVNYQPDQEAFARNLHHLFYGLNDSIYIVTDQAKKIPISSYQLDRNWGIGTVNRMALQFPQVAEGCDLAQSKSFQVVVQNLNSLLPELRFDFSPNPVQVSQISLADLMKSLQVPQAPEPGKETQAPQR